MFSDCLSIDHPVSSISDNICLVREFLVAGCTKTGRSYDVMLALVGSFGRRCGKSSPSVAEQPFVIEICNFGNVCTVI